MHALYPGEDCLINMPGLYLNTRTRLRDTLVGSLRSQCIRRKSKSESEDGNPLSKESRRIYVSELV